MSVVRERTIGVPRPRLDSEAKVRGVAGYAADIRHEGLLHARLVLAQEAHARLRSIDRAQALAVPGVVAVLTAADLPLRGAGDSRADAPLARDEILFAGQPLAVVVAETAAAAEDAAELVVAKTKPLPAVTGLDAALAPDAPRARLHEETDVSDLGSEHADVGEGSEEAPAKELDSPNVAASRRSRHGDAAAELAASHIVVSGRFRTQWIYQAYLEPQVVTAYPGPGGSLLVETSTQAPFQTRAQLAGLLGLPLDRVRVTPTPLGGSFGGKMMLTESLVAAAAVALGRPVRLELTRSEDFLAGNPAPAGEIELRIGATSDGMLTALDAKIVFERGAIHGWGVEAPAAALVGSVYRWRAFDVRSYGVETNRVGFGAYRAPGAPPAAFAVESLIDELADRLGLDPAELRAKNLAGQGDLRADGKPWGSFGVRECLELLEEHPLWRERGSLPEGEGVGLAFGIWPGAGDAAAAGCRLDDDGRITVVTGIADMTGATTALAAIAAEIIGVPAEHVRVVVADTASAPRSPMVGGSKTTFAVGRAVAAAAEDAKAQLLELAATELEADPADLEITDGLIHPRGAPSQGVPLVALGRKVASGSVPPVEGRGRAAAAPPSPSVAGHLAHVRVDRETGGVSVLDWVIAQDVGRALNPALCEGQMQGGVAQAIGWALYEELLADGDGHVLNGSFANYVIPGASELPPIETLLVELPAPDGPFGAKGIGEACVVGGPAAVANAIAAATGARLRELPMTPERVLAAVAAAV
jgi:CO/xanthine dehydrogenase Mo-binding subunit